MCPSQGLKSSTFLRERPEPVPIFSQPLSVSKSRLVLALLPIVLLAAEGSKKEAPKPDLDQLMGPWMVVSGASVGQAAPVDALIQARMVFKGDRLTASSENGKTDVLRFKIDPSAKTKTIDITNLEKKQTILGIYVLDGDRLKLCLGAPGSARTRDFATKKGSGMLLLVLEREK
jgi:uncharacterized protein (TIGR03067 family)